MKSTKTKKNVLVSSLVNYALRNALQVQETKVYKLNLVEEGVKTFNNGSYYDSNLNLKFVIISKATAVRADMVLFVPNHNIFYAKIWVV